jgi:hypothetical protein
LVKSVRIYIKRVSFANFAFTKNHLQIPVSPHKHRMKLQSSAKNSVPGTTKMQPPSPIKKRQKPPISVPGTKFNPKLFCNENHFSLLNQMTVA